MGQSDPLREWKQRLTDWLLANHNDGEDAEPHPDHWTHEDFARIDYLEPFVYTVVEVADRIRVVAARQYVMDESGDLVDYEDSFPLEFDLSGGYLETRWFKAEE